MNDRQLALVLSFVLHLSVLFILAYIEIQRLPPESGLFEIVMPAVEEKIPEETPPPEPAVPEPEEIPPQRPEPEVPREAPVRETVREPSTQEPEGKPVPEAGGVTALTGEDSLKAFMERLQAYFRDQWIVPLQGKPAQFMDFDRQALLAPRDTSEALQRILETRLAEMALSPEEIEEIYPEGDIVEDRLKKDQGIMPALPGVPAGLLAKAAIELTKKAIGFFKNTPEKRTTLLDLTEAEVFILHVMWIIGKTTMPDLYAVLPLQFPIVADELNTLLESWSDAKLITREQRGQKTLYYPALSRSEVLQFFLSRLAVLHWEDNNSGENVKLRQSIIRKIAILNNISLSEYADSSK